VRGRIVVAIALGAVLPACSATTPVTIDSPGPASPDASPIVSLSTSPSKAPPTPRAREAVYALDGALWLYDVAADTVRPLTQSGSARSPRWMGPGLVSFISDGVGGERSSALMQLDIKGSAITELFRVATGIATYGWSPDLSTVAYVTVDDHDFPQIHYRAMANGSIRTVATLARQFGREGVDDDQLRVEYSPDGERVLIVYTVAGGGGEDVSPDSSQLQVRTSDGSLAFAPEQRNGPTMGAWAADGSAIFFRINAGARTWRIDGSTGSVPASPVWFNPAVSRNGRYIAFDTGASDPRVVIRLLDLRRGTVKIIGERGRAHPVFAANRIVWAQRIRRCTGECLVPGEPVLEVVAIDITNGTEKPLAITSLLDTDVRYA